MLTLVFAFCSKVETWAVAISGDGQQVASSAKSGNINLWSIETGEKVQVLEPGGKFTMSVAFVSDPNDTSLSHYTHD